jgi:membrane-bound lytic murein transglycosylase D
MKRVNGILKPGRRFILLCIFSAFYCQASPIPGLAPEVQAPTLPAPAVAKDQALSKDQILKDIAQRLPPDFQIPEGLQRRVSFWFDIYSKYTSDDNVIHHADYPWIVFRVVNTKDVPADPKNRWARGHRIEKIVRAERARVKKLLLKLSKRRSFKHLSADESALVELLKEIPGKRSRVYREAARNVRNQLGQKDFILNGLATSQKYFPYLEVLFRERGLPTELTRLPLVESSFNEAAVSKVGASGIWQLMPAIGRKFLRMTKDIDERNSPFKATEAAARLMAQNYKILKTWPLALTAYNHGPGGLLRAKKKLKTSDISAIVKHYSSASFGFASSNFYCSFLAALFVEKYKTELFGELPERSMPEVKVVELPRRVKIKNLAQALALDAEELRAYNLDIKEKAIRRNHSLPKGYRLFLPVERLAQLDSFLASLPTAVGERDSRPKVKTGGT